MRRMRDRLRHAATVGVILGLAVTTPAGPGDAGERHPISGIAPPRLAGAWPVTVPASARAGSATRTDPVAGCAPTDPLVFADDFGCGVWFFAFAGSKLDAFSFDPTVSYLGGVSFKAVVPAVGDPSGTYTGGTFTADDARDLTGYDAVTFWVKGSRPASLDVVGLGNDNTGASRFVAQISGVPITTAWMSVIIPIPSASRLGAERGLLFLAKGPEAGAGMTLWFDEIRFVHSDAMSNPRPALTTQTINPANGTTIPIPGTFRTVFNVNGTDQTVTHGPGYLTFMSSDPGVVAIAGDSIRALAVGTATITAALDGIPASGSITVSVGAVPATAAPDPTLPAANVLSLFSNAYPNWPVDTWSATWDMATVADVTIAGNDTKLYTGLGYAAIEFTSHPIDASGLTHLHLDVWIPSGAPFKVKLVDFGANGVFAGGDDSQSEVVFDAGSNPPLVNGSWVALEIPLANFTGLASRAHLAQMLFSGSTPTVYVDNVYFHDALTGVEDRGAVDLALRGVTPNPTRGALRVSLVLPDASPATLSLFDVSGRLLASERVDRMGPGAHSVVLAGRDRLPAGIYLIRLSQGGRDLATRVAVVR